MIKQIVFLESGLRKNSISNTCFSADIHMRMVIENFYKNFRKNGEICSKFAVKNQNVWSLFPGSDNFRCWSRVAFADFDQMLFVREWNWQFTVKSEETEVRHTGKFKTFWFIRFDLLCHLERRWGEASYSKKINKSY